MSKEHFDFDEHERQLAMRYEQLARVEAFDRFIDLALDGVVTMDAAIRGYQEEVGLVEVHRGTAAED